MQDIGDLLQHFVACRVAIGVVKALEVVHVQHYQREREVIPVCPIDLILKLFLKFAVVLQARKPVRYGLRFQQGVGNFPARGS